MAAHCNSINVYTLLCTLVENAQPLTHTYTMCTHAHAFAIRMPIQYIRLLCIPYAAAFARHTKCGEEQEQWECRWSERMKCVLAEWCALAPLRVEFEWMRQPFETVRVCACVYLCVYFCFFTSHFSYLSDTVSVSVALPSFRTYGARDEVCWCVYVNTFLCCRESIQRKEKEVSTVILLFVWTSRPPSRAVLCV